MKTKKNGSSAKYAWCLDGSMCYACPGATGGSVCQCECHSDSEDKDPTDTD